MKQGMWLGLAACTAMCSLTSAAHALEVKEKTEIKGTPAAVWEKVGGWCAIKDWHPALAACEETKEGDIVRRILTLKDGGKIKEKLTGQTKDSYSYVIEESPLPVKNYSATFKMIPDADDDDEVNLVWTAKFEASGKSDKEATDVITGVFTGGLAGIKSTLKASK